MRGGVVQRRGRRRGLGDGGAGRGGEGGRRRRGQRGEVMPKAGRALDVLSLAAIAVERQRDEPFRRADDERERRRRGGLARRKPRQQECQRGERGKQPGAPAEEGQEPRHAERYGVAPRDAQGSPGIRTTREGPRG